MTDGPEGTSHDLIVEQMGLIHEDAQQYYAWLAEDWPEHQVRSGLTVHSYLVNYEDEVRSRLYANASEVSDPLWSIRQHIRQGSLHSDAAQAILEARTFKTVVKVHATHEPDPDGLAEVAFYYRVYTQAFRKASPAGVTVGRQVVEDHIRNPLVASAFQMALDRSVYHSALHSRELADAVTKPRQASSEMGRTAIRAAIDHKVLAYALRTWKTDQAGAAEIIKEYASTAGAREAMLGHFALRQTKSRVRGWGEYSRRIQRDFAQERLREEERERFRRVYEERQKRQRSKDEQARRSRSRGQGSAGDRVSAMFAQVDSQARDSLRACSRKDIELLMDQVGVLRTENPGITPRQIYVHFHGRIQGPNRQPRDEEMVKILGLMLGANFNKGNNRDSATLPF